MSECKKPKPSGTKSRFVQSRYKTVQSKDKTVIHDSTINRSANITFNPSCASTPAPRKTQKLNTTRAPAAPKPPKIAFKAPDTTKLPAKTSSNKVIKEELCIRPPTSLLLKVDKMSASKLASQIESELKKCEEKEAVIRRQTKKLEHVQALQDIEERVRLVGMMPDTMTFINSIHRNQKEIQQLNKSSVIPNSVDISGLLKATEAANSCLEKLFSKYNVEEVKRWNENCNEIRQHNKAITELDEKVIACHESKEQKERWEVALSGTVSESVYFC